jgi:effector-binding domain-containing protein
VVSLSDEVVQLVVPARPTAVVATTTSWNDFPALWRQLLDEVWAAVRAHTSIVPGRNIMLYRDDRPSVEVGIEVGAPFERIGRVFCSTLPAGRVAMTTHRGSFEVGPAHRAVVEACAQLGLERLGPRWEIYGHWNQPGDEAVEIYHLLR